MKTNNVIYKTDKNFWNKRNRVQKKISWVELRQKLCESIEDPSVLVPDTEWSIFEQTLSNIEVRPEDKKY